MNIEEIYTQTETSEPQEQYKCHSCGEFTLDGTCTDCMEEIDINLTKGL